MVNRRNNNIHRIVFYSDILGFSEKVYEDIDNARNYLDNFYQIIYRKFRNNEQNIISEPRGTILSDSVVIFSIDVLSTTDFAIDLYQTCLLQDDPILLRGSIASGRLIMENRRELRNLRKNFIMGEGLVKAVLPDKKGLKGARLLIFSDIVGAIDSEEYVLDNKRIKLTRDFYAFDINWLRTRNRNRFIRLYRKIMKLYQSNLLKTSNVLSHYQKTCVIAEKARQKLFPDLNIDMNID